MSKRLFSSIISNILFFHLILKTSPLQHSRYPHSEYAWRNRGQYFNDSTIRYIGYSVQYLFINSSSLQINESCPIVKKVLRQHLFYRRVCTLRDSLESMHPKSNNTKHSPPPYITSTGKKNCVSSRSYFLHVVFFFLDTYYYQLDKLN